MVPHDHNKAMHRGINIAPIPLFKLYTPITLARSDNLSDSMQFPYHLSLSDVLLHPKASMFRILRTNGALCFRLSGSLSKALRASLKVSYSL